MDADALLTEAEIRAERTIALVRLFVPPIGVTVFFALLKRERVNRVHYRTRDEARADLFDYIEVFYNRKRRHGYLGNISPDDYEERTSGSY